MRKTMNAARWVCVVAMVFGAVLALANPVAGMWVIIAATTWIKIV